MDRKRTITDNIWPYYLNVPFLESPVLLSNLFQNDLGLEGLDSSKDYSDISNKLFRAFVFPSKGNIRTIDGSFLRRVSSGDTKSVKFWNDYVKPVIKNINQNNRFRSVMPSDAETFLSGNRPLAVGDKILSDAIKGTPIEDLLQDDDYYKRLDPKTILGLDDDSNGWNIDASKMKEYISDINSFVKSTDVENSEDLSKSIKIISKELINKVFSGKTSKRKTSSLVPVNFVITNVRTPLGPEEDLSYAVALNNLGERLSKRLNLDDEEVSSIYEKNPDLSKNEIKKLIWEKASKELKDLLLQDPSFLYKLVYGNTSEKELLNKFLNFADLVTGSNKNSKLLVYPLIPSDPSFDYDDSIQEDVFKRTTPLFGIDRDDAFNMIRGISSDPESIVRFIRRINKDNPNSLYRLGQNVKGKRMTPVEYLSYLRDKSSSIYPASKSTIGIENPLEPATLPSSIFTYFDKTSRRDKMEYNNAKDQISPLSSLEKLISSKGGRAALDYTAKKDVEDVYLDPDLVNTLYSINNLDLEDSGSKELRDNYIDRLKNYIFYDIEDNKVTARNPKSSRGDDTGRGFRYEHITPIRFLERLVNFIYENEPNKSKANKYAEEAIKKLHKIAYTSMLTDKQLDDLDKSTSGLLASKLGLKEPIKKGDLSWDSSTLKRNRNVDQLMKDINELSIDDILNARYGSDKPVSLKTIFKGKDSIEIPNIKKGEMVLKTSELRESKTPKLTSLIFGYYG